MQVNLVLITVGNGDEARNIARELVASKLAAAVNIIDNIQSVYTWEGEIRDAAETLLIAKSLASKVPAVVEKVKEIHTYELPCIVSLPVLGGHHPYMDWVAAQLG